MSINDNGYLWVTNTENLKDGGYLKMDVYYAGEIIPVIIIRHKGKCFAYRNRCLHMPRELDCIEDKIFDESGQYLRCSMHGIVYEPTTGETASDLCYGKQLTAIELMENEQGVWITDRRVQPLVARSNEHATQSDK